MTEVKEHSVQESLFLGNDDAMFQVFKVKKGKKNTETKEVKGNYI